MMEYYSVKEVARFLGLSTRKVYTLIKEIEDTTPHQFGRLHRGRYYKGNPRKEKVISERDLKLLECTVGEGDEKISALIQEKLGARLLD